MGWFLSDYRDRKVVAHGGNIDGMTAVVGMMPEEEVGVVVLTNLNGNYLTYSVMTRIFDHYLGDPEGGMRDWSAELLDELGALRAEAETQEAEVEASRVAGTSPSAALEEYAGTYRHPMFGELSLSLEGDVLVASRGSQWIGDAEHWHHDTFRVEWRDRMMGESYLTIRLDLMGVPEAISIQGMEGDFERVPAEEEGAP
jgi:hypothetical protein